MGLILLLFTYQELAAACNAESDDMEVKFMSILCTRSFPHLRKGKDLQRTQTFKKIHTWVQVVVPAHMVLLFTVFQEFVRFTNKDIEQIIKKEMSGDVKNTFYAIGSYRHTFNCCVHM